jgi:hypothetical protein
MLLTLRRSVVIVVRGDSSRDGPERSRDSPKKQCNLGFQPVFSPIRPNFPSSTGLAKCVQDVILTLQDNVGGRRPDGFKIVCKSLRGRNAFWAYSGRTLG